MKTTLPAPSAEDFPVTLNVVSLPIRDVLTDLAKATGGEIRKDANYFILDLPDEVGSGTISGIDFNHGFGMINYRCTFRRDTEISFNLDQVHPLKFLYVHVGNFSHRFEGDDDHHAISTYQNLMVASERHNGHVIRFTREEPVSICSIEIDRIRFCRRFEEYFLNEKGLFRDLLFDVKASRKFLYEGDYALTIAGHVEKVLGSPLDGVMRSMFYEGKSYEILVDQWLQYLEDVDKMRGSRLLRRATVERILECIEYIKNNLTADLSIAALSVHSGLNSAELQQGFQYSTGMTVNNYVREQKLLTAMRLLRSGEFNVSETLHQIGFLSLSYFSKKFKERWGVSPSLIGQHPEGEEE